MAILAKALPFAAATALVVWTLLSAFVLANRLLHEVWSRRISMARRRLAPSSPRRTPPHAGTSRAARALSTLPRRVVMRIAADRTTPPSLAAALAAHAIARFGEARLLRNAARHRGERGRWRRIAALRVLTKADHAGSLPLLLSALDCGDPTVVDAAVALLGDVADVRAAEALLQAMERRLYSPSRIATALERFPLDIAERLLTRLGHVDPVVRYWAAALLERFPKAPQLGARLAALVGDRDASVRKAAVHTLAGIVATEAAPAALGLLADPVFFVRAHAARALGELGRADLAPHLVPLLADREWWVRLAAKQALEAIGGAGTPVLEQALDHEDRFARNGAAEVLQNLGVLDDRARRLSHGQGGADLTLLKAVRAGGRPLLQGLAARNGGAPAGLDAALVSLRQEIS